MLKEPILVRTGLLKKSIKLIFKKDGLAFSIDASGDRKKISEYNSDRPHVNEPGYLYSKGGEGDSIIEEAMTNEFNKMWEEGIII